MLINLIRHHFDSDQDKRNTAVVLFILTGLVCLLLSARKPLGDYANYYYGSYFALQHIPAEEIYDPIAFNLLIQAEGEQDVFANYAPIPPFSLLFYIPFVFVNAALSKFLFGLLGLWLCAFSLNRLLSHYPIHHYGLFLLPLILLLPLKSNLYLGQSYLYILCFLMEGFIFSKQEKGEVPAALLFSLAIALKIFPAVILIYLLFSGQKKTFVYTIAFTILWFASSISLVGIEQLTEYLTHSLPRLFNGEINDPYSSSYQSVTVLLKKLFVPDALLNPKALFDARLLFTILNLLFSTFVLSCCIKVCRSSSYDLLFRFGFTLFCGLLISGYGTGYALLLLVFLFIPLMNTADKFENKLYLYCALLLFITTLPIHWFFNQIVPLQFIRLYAMLLLFILIIFSNRMPVSILPFIGSLLVLAIPVLLNALVKKENPSTYYLTYTPSLLVYGYHQEPRGISLAYYNEKGTHKFIHETSDKINSDNNLTVKNGHIYYKGQALTYGNNKNKSPMLLNKDEVIYLSDKGRGIGLYALRKTKLP